MFKQGVLLDEKLSEVLKCIAFQENYCNSRESNSTKKYVLENKSLIEQYRFETLSSLIIFGKLYSNSYSLRESNIEKFSINRDWINFSTLINEGVFEFIKVKDDDLTSWELNTRTSDFNMFKDLIIQGTEYYLKYNLHNYKYTEKDIIEAHEAISSVISRRKNQLDDFFIQNLKDYEGLESPYYDLILDNLEQADLIDSMIFSYRNIASTIKSSRKENIYSKLSIPNLCIRNHINLNQSDDYIQAYKVILEEDITFPFPKTLKDAINLSKDKRVKEFRNVLKYWVDALNNSNLEDLSSFRREINKAKVDLKKIKQMKKIGRIVSFISLPVSVASILLQLPLGIILAPIGPAINIKSYFTEQKYKWLMFGKWQ